MKKAVLFLAALAVIFSVVGCSSNTENVFSEPNKQEEMAFSEFQWPDTDIAGLMPVPKSNIGRVDWSEEYGFVVYVAETSADDFNDYADECERLGFTNDLRRGDDFIFADNADGYHASVRLDGGVMFVRIDRPDEENDAAAEKQPETTAAEETTVTNETAVPEDITLPEKTAVPANSAPEDVTVPTEKPSENIASAKKDNASETEHTAEKNDTPAEKHDTPTAPAEDKESGKKERTPSDTPTVTVPDEPESGGNLVWVPTKGGTKFHSNSRCSKMIEPIQVSRETAIANGYTQCKKCF